MDLGLHELEPVPFSSPLFVNLESLPILSEEAEFYTDVVPLQHSSGALHNNCVSFHSDVDIFWNVDSLVAENSLHSHGGFRKESILRYCFCFCFFKLINLFIYLFWLHQVLVAAREIFSCGMRTLLL